MADRLRHALALLAASVLLASVAPVVRAEDEEPAAPAAPADEKPGGDAKPADTIFKDWKEAKKKGVAHAKERAAHWEAQGVKGKDLLWLGLMWNRGQDYAKAAKAIEESISAADITDKNKETARWTLIEVYARQKDWPKMVATAEKFRAEHPTSGLATGTWIEEGRGRRMTGEREKAVAAFTKAAEDNNLTAIFELLDLHLAEGNKEAAAAVLTTFADADIKGKDQYFTYWKDFLSVVGTDAPSIADAKSVGKGEGFTSFKGKPTVLYFWHMQVTNPENRLGNLLRFASLWGDKVQVAAVSTYNKYNPDVTKKEEGMTEEQELDWYRQFAEKIVGRSMPPAIVVPTATIPALKLKWEGTKLLIDAEGKFRYARTFENAPYGWDWTALELATKAAAGS